MFDEMNDIITVQEASEYFGCSKNYLYQLIKTNKLEGCCKFGKHYFIPKTAFKKFFENANSPENNA